MKKYLRLSYLLPASISAILGMVVILLHYTQWEGGRPVRFLLMDDAMISMGFARSLAEGCGLVWYCGAPKVEGYTNLGWVLYMTFWHLWGIPPEYTSLPILLTGLFTLVWHIRGIYKVALLFGEQTARIATWMAAIFPPLIFHHLSGLEAGFLAMLLTYYLYQSLRLVSDIKQMAGIALIGTLTRPDFIIGIVAVSAAKAAVLWIQRDSIQLQSKELKGLALAVLVAALTLIATTLWRKGYYGLWAPNTYTLKVTSVPFSWRISNGLISTLVNLRHNTLAWMLAAAGFWIQRRSLNMYVVISLLGASIAYNIYVGGDIYEEHISNNRFLLNGFVSLLVLASVGIAYLSQRGGVRTALILLVSYGSPAPWSQPVEGSRWRYFLDATEPPPLAPVHKLFPVGSRLLIDAAGKLPYFFRDYRWIDFFGKVDTATARHGHIVMCHIAPPPYLYYTGHTRIDTSYIWSIDGIIAPFILDSCMCARQAAHSPPPPRWWHKLFRRITPCKEEQRPSWFPFPDPTFRSRFCATYELIPEFHDAWRRKTRFVPIMESEAAPSFDCQSKQRAREEDKGK